MLSTSCTNAHANAKPGCMRPPYENIARLSCDICFTGHFGHGIRWWPLFSYLIQGQVGFRSRKVKFLLNIFFKIIPILFSLSQHSKNIICSDARKLEKPKIACQKMMSSLFLIFQPWYRRKKYWFEVLYACC